MWGSSILNEQANCSERVFGNKICAQECMETTRGRGWQWCIQCLGSACRMYGGHNVWGRGSYCRWKLISPRQITQDPPLWRLGRRKVSKLQTDTKAIRKESGRISSMEICRRKKTWCMPALKKSNFGRCLRCSDAGNCIYWRPQHWRLVVNSEVVNPESINYIYWRIALCVHDIGIGQRWGRTRIYCVEAGHLFDIHDMCKGYIRATKRLLPHTVEV